MAGDFSLTEGESEAVRHRNSTPDQPVSHRQSGRLRPGTQLFRRNQAEFRQFLVQHDLALRLHVVSKRPAASYPLAFFVGEFLKIASTVGLLATVRLVYPDVHWLALFLGLVVALKANLFAFLVKT